jgi:3-oxoadipate enol-lactonase
MPFANLPNVAIHYALTGDPSHPPLILSNSLGADLSMWDAQAPVFEKQFRLLRYDMRGHGKSSSPAPPYSVAQLADDLLALADSVGFGRFHLCGLSVGGMIGMHLALHAPQRLRKLVLCNTAAKIGTDETWNARIDTVRSQGMAAVGKLTPARWFTSSFQSNHPERVAASLRVLEALSPEGYVGGCCAVRDFDMRTDVSRIKVPTLVVSGTHDPAATPSDGHYLAEQIPGARYVELKTSHISSIEDPTGLNAAVLSFLNV